MKNKARAYSAQEKAHIALEAIKGEYTLSQISSKYGVHCTQINRWKKEALENLILGFQTKPKKEEESQAELISTLYEQMATSN